MSKKESWEDGYLWELQPEEWIAVAMIFLFGMVIMILLLSFGQGGK